MAEDPAAAARLEDLNLKIDDCVSTGDADGLAACLADDYLYTHSNGRTNTKAEYVEAVRRRPDPPRRVLTNNQVEIHDDVAITRGDMDIVYADGRPTLYMRYVRIWRERSGQWQAISHRTLYATDRKPEEN